MEVIDMDREAWVEYEGNVGIVYPDGITYGKHVTVYGVTIPKVDWPIYIITLAVDDIKWFFGVDNLGFSALKSLRRELESYGLQIKCNGSAENAYPFGLGVDMGGGFYVHLRTIGQQPWDDEPIHIFDCIDTLNFVSIAKQEAFHEQWIRSINEL